MKNLFEYINPLTSQYEAFIQDTKQDKFPIQKHWHYFVEILYILEGSILIEHNNKMYTAGTGSLVLFHAKTLHAIYPAGEKEASYIVVKFDDNILNISNSYLPKIKYILTYANQDANARSFFPEGILKPYSVKTLLLEIVEEFNKKSYGYDLLIRSNLHKLFSYFIRIWNNEGFQAGNVTAANRYLKSFDTISEYIDAHYYEDIQVHDLAQMCNMAHSTFSENFKERFGKTCKEYINYVRINAAQNLLLFTEYDINYISQEVGFTDSSYFIRCYKKLKGVSPKQHKKQMFMETGRQNTLDSKTF